MLYLLVKCRLIKKKIKMFSLYDKIVVWIDSWVFSVRLKWAMYKDKLDAKKYKNRKRKD